MGGSNIKKMDEDREKECQAVKYWKQSEALPCQRERGLGRPSPCHQGAWTLAIADSGREDGGGSLFPALHAGRWERRRGGRKSKQIYPVTQNAWCGSVSWRRRISSKHGCANDKRQSFDHHLRYVHSDNGCGERLPCISSCDNVRGASFHDVRRKCQEFIPALKTQTRHPKSKGQTKVSNPKKWCSYPFSSWLLSNVIFLSFITQFTAYTAASPAILSSYSTARYYLLPPSSNTSSIFIQFNPPSLQNLRVNTRQEVFFNFTIHQRNGGFHSQAQPNDSDNGSFSKSHVSNANNNNNNNNRNSNNVSSVKTTSTFLLRNDSGHARPGSSTQASFDNQGSQSLPVTTSTDNVSLPEVKFANNHGRKGYLVMIYSSDDRVALPFLPRIYNGQKDRMEVSPDTQHSFSIEGKHLGKVSMSVAVVDLANDKAMLQPNYVPAVAATEYSVMIVRGERTADHVFNSAAAAIAILISFGMGAATEVDCLKRQLKYPVALIIAFCCQFIMMPVMAFGIAMALPLNNDISFGLLCVACVPGGGLGHVAVIIADGDTALSMTINLISSVAMLGTAPLWIFVLGQYFQTESDAALNPRMIPMFSFEIWLLSSFVAYIAGLIIKRFKPCVADAILMWLIKPILLLASILYITLGVYINMYVFNIVKEFALLGAVLLPFCGCVLGGMMAAICRQGHSFIRTIALETASLNCLVVLVALRFSLQQPNADSAAMIPIWVMFTIPGLFVFLAIVNKLYNTIMHYWRQRNNNTKDPELLGSSKAYSVSSSVVSPPGTTTLSAPLVVADGADDDLTISTMSNQKVTVL